MINWDKIDKKINIKKTILPVFMVILILLIIIYFCILNRYICKSIFASKMQEISQKNEIPEFSIEKIYLCSSANAIDNSEEQNLRDLELYQYTDIAIYLNNYKDNGLNSKNTIKELYIDNIELQLENNDIGEAILDYTNSLKMGSKDQLKKILATSEFKQKDKIDFNIINTNEQNNKANYDEPTFYADCSNPISLKYINKINRNFNINNDRVAIFDGSILKKAEIKLEDISAKIKFRVNIVNNNNEYNSAYVSFKIPLDDIYQGTSIKSKNISGKEYNFFSI